MADCRTFCSGVIVFYDDEVVLVKTKHGHYGFPKGKRHKKESDMDNALRELREESGIVESDINFCKYSNGDYVLIDEIKNIKPSIRYFVAELKKRQEINMEDPDELDEVSYYKVDQALKIETDKFICRRKKILTTAHDLIKKIRTCILVDADSDNPIAIKDDKVDETLSHYHKKLSKSLSWILRHGIIKEKLEMDNIGYVKLNDIMKLRQISKYTIDDVKHVVESNEKSRFTLITDINGDLFIRANQGHSADVAALLDEDSMLERLIKPLDICVHGTDPSAYELIKKTSLKPMSRCHIHLASGLPNDSDIVSGMRPECKVHIYIDMLKAMRVGKRFYCSSNGVILTPDSLEPELFKRVDIL